VSTPCRVTRLHTAEGHLHVSLEAGEDIHTRAVVIATGARYRTLPLPNWQHLEGGGIFYAATEMEARTCAAAPVVVVGGANSAGQAALFLAGRGSAVTLVVRGPDLARGMSRYLVDRVLAHPRISVRLDAEISALHGEASLQAVTVRDRTTAASGTLDCHGLFCFIGAAPATEWLHEVALDDDGFVYTDTQLTERDLPAGWVALGRRPQPFETSVPGVFAVGDVRHGSMKRVAAAVGEGASAIRSVHVVLGAAVA
jgi:thioredoxin reductase (NADPH)